jgi:hypothetical protein
LEFEVTGTVIEWRGPSPFYFLPIPPAHSAEIKEVAHAFTYGWGVLYATIYNGDYRWTTALIPKNDQYLIPLKTEARKHLGIDLGQVVTLKIKLGK